MGVLTKEQEELVHMAESDQGIIESSDSLALCALIRELAGKDCAGCKDLERDVLDLAEDMRTLIRLLATKPDWRGAPFVMKESSHRALAELERVGR